MDIRRQPIDDASAWRGADLTHDRSWQYGLEPEQIDELARALSAVKRANLKLPEINRDTFPLPSLAPSLKRIADDLRDGRGFALLTGFPVDDHSFEDLERLYWGLCMHIGTGITQNSDGGLIHYVTEGPLRPNQGKRGVGFPQKASLHIDLMDVVSLLCVRQAPDEPPSWVASSMTVYNEILRRHPDQLERLYQGFRWDRMDEHGDGEDPMSAYRVPVFSQADGKVSCQYNRHWMQVAADRARQPFSAEENALLDLIDTIADAIKFEFPFRAGDIQFCNNYTVLHGRAAHKVEPVEDRRRVLMRIWLDMPNVRPFSDESIVRYGNGRHGQLGWTAADLLAQRNLAPRPRRSDGAPLVGSSVTS